MVLGARLMRLEDQNERHQQSERPAGLEGDHRIERQPNHKAEDAERAEATGPGYRLECDTAHLFHLATTRPDGGKATRIITPEPGRRSWPRGRFPENFQPPKASIGRYRRAKSTARCRSSRPWPRSPARK